MNLQVFRVKRIHFVAFLLGFKSRNIVTEVQICLKKINFCGSGFFILFILFSIIFIIFDRE